MNSFFLATFNTYSLSLAFKKLLIICLNVGCFEFINWKFIKRLGGVNSFILSCFNNVWIFATPIDYSLPNSSVHGILQARILEWVLCPPPRDLPDPGIEHTALKSPALADRFFTTSTNWEAPYRFIPLLNWGYFKPLFILVYYLLISLFLGLPQ